MALHAASNLPHLFQDIQYLIQPKATYSECAFTKSGNSVPFVWEVFQEQALFTQTYGYISWSTFEKGSNTGWTYCSVITKESFLEKVLVLCLLVDWTGTLKWMGRECMLKQVWQQYIFSSSCHEIYVGFRGMWRWAVLITRFSCWWSTYMTVVDVAKKS